MQKSLTYLSIIIVSALAGAFLSGQTTGTDTAGDPEAVQTEQNLFEYILLGDEEKLRAALASGSDVNSSNSAGETLLHTAVTLGDVATVETLLENGADADAKNAQQQTPLSISVVADDIAVMKPLIDAGASTVETVKLDGKNLTLFDVAVANGSFEAAVLLDPEKAGSLEEELSLIEKGLELTDAAKAGDTEAIHDLVQKGAELEFRDENSWLPLIHAAANGHAKAVTALIELGAEINAKAANNVTALHAATLGNHIEAVRVLSGAGADQSVLVEDKFTAYDLAKAQGFLALLNLLEEPENKNESEDVFTLIQNGDVGLVMSLFKSEWPLMTKADAAGWTPLMHAIQAGQNELAVHILRETDNEAKRYASDGTTPLLIAATEGNVLMALELLKNGAALEQRVKGVTIPEIAARKGHQGLSEHLIEQLKEQTENLQRELNLFGMIPGPWDGIWGDGTRKAVQQVHAKYPETAVMTHKKLTDWLYNKNRAGFFYCNHSNSENLWFAIAYTSSRTNGAVSHGWYKTGRFECRRHHIPGNNIIAYAYAEGNNGTWGNGESKFCVHKREGFEIEHPTACQGQDYEKLAFSGYPFGGSQRRWAKMVE